jgi:flagellar basal body-associated protein FliL
VKLIFLAIFLAVGMGLAACGGGHPAAAHSATQTASPEIAADRTICKTFTANIGDGGEQAIANALVANPLVSAKLAHEIGLALTGTTLHADLVAQVKVSVDCAETKYDHVPNEG